MILNRIILKNPNNDISLKANPKGFQRLQNTSNVSNSNIQPNNNIFNEIKNENLKDEIHKIINTSSSLDSGRRRKKNSDLELNKNIDKEDKKVLDNNNKQMSDIIEEDNNQIKEEEKNIKEIENNTHTPDESLSRKKTIKDHLEVNEVSSPTKGNSNSVQFKCSLKKQVHVKNNYIHDL